jgi:hypothetical protein
MLFFNNNVTLGRDNRRGSTGVATGAPGTPSQGNYAWSAFQASPDPATLPIPSFLHTSTASTRAIDSECSTREASDALRKMLGVSGTVIANGETT